MKKFGFGLMAILTAVTSAALTTNSKDKTGCNGSYFWYYVLSGQGNVVTGVGSKVDITKLDLTTYPDFNSDNVVTYDDFVGRIVTESNAEATFTCPDIGGFKCAIGFEVDATPNEEFEVLSGKVVPRSNMGNQSIPLVACIIKRTVM